jgi:hypothetical protein
LNSKIYEEINKINIIKNFFFFEKKKKKPFFIFIKKNKFNCIQKENKRTKNTYKIKLINLLFKKINLVIDLFIFFF